MGTPTTGVAGLVTTNEAGRLLGVSSRAILMRIRRYNVPAVAVGRVLLVSLADLVNTYHEPPRLREATR